MQKQILFSGIRTSGAIHIGNYLGAIKNWINLQNQYQSFFCLVDEHAITTPWKPEELRENVLNTATLYLACGVNPEKSAIFIQSQVPEHTQLAWILNTITSVGELSRMTQFKEKTEKRKTVMAGLLNYPVLMAADILLYKTNLVPIGDDQKQHLEFTRMIANKFNRMFGKTFIIPETYITEETKRIMGLDDPLKKMSKSAESVYNYISLFDEPDAIRDKIKKAVTDSGKEIRYNLKIKPAISNLLNIMSGVSGLKIPELEKKYSGMNYVNFKEELAEKIVEFLAPIQKRYEELQKNQKEVLNVLKNGKKQAEKIASQTMKEVKEKVGFI